MQSDDVQRVKRNLGDRYESWLDQGIEKDVDARLGRILPIAGAVSCVIAMLIIWSFDQPGHVRLFLTLLGLLSILMITATRSRHKLLLAASCSLGALLSLSAMTISLFLPALLVMTAVVAQLVLLLLVNRRDEQESMRMEATRSDLSHDSIVYMN